MIKRLTRVAGFAALLVGAVAGSVPTAAQASPAKINGSGSTYVALAMQQWVADAQTNGLSINYLPTGSPQGLTQFGQSLIDFAGTEAEYSALGNAGGADQRGYQYVPDVAGAVAIMYNVDDKAGRKVDYLHLSRETIARIFIGEISSWSDPAISADNGGLEFPNQPITVVYRGGQSGTTALFYDFVQHTVPGKFSAWASRNELPTSVRIIQLDSAPNFAPKTLALNGSDQIAQYVASAQGKWAIAYDEFGYAKTYHAPAAWVQNESGEYVLPYAQNISAALEGARLRADLSQELSGVYANPAADAYPISAYSYMVTQCAPNGERASCKGAYDNPGVAETLAQWMRYIACEGQVNMARIGYSPLPPNLSQEIVNSIARMTGGQGETLSAGNCANPRFSGSLGKGASSPTDPLKGKVVLPGSGSSGSGTTSSTALPGATSRQSSGVGNTSKGGADTAVDPTTGQVVAVASDGDDSVAGNGGSSLARVAAPVAYRRGEVPSTNGVPALLLLLVIATPPLLVGRRRRDSARNWL